MAGKGKMRIQRETDNRRASTTFSSNWKPKSSSLIEYTRTSYCHRFQEQSIEFFIESRGKIWSGNMSERKSADKLDAREQTFQKAKSLGKYWLKRVNWLQIWIEIDLSLEIGGAESMETWEMSRKRLENSSNRFLFNFEKGAVNETTSCEARQEVGFLEKLFETL
jgi:hypothetical protein